MSITIDSVTYDVPIKTLRRKAELLFKYAERTADGVLHAEPIGTFYNFELSAGMSAENIADYAALWVKLTDPDWEHEITLPDESGTLTFDCYFGSISDEVVKDGSTNYFRNLTFSVIAISPERTPS